MTFAEPPQTATAVKLRPKRARKKRRKKKKEASVAGPETSDSEAETDSLLSGESTQSLPVAEGGSVVVPGFGRPSTSSSSLALPIDIPAPNLSDDDEVRMDDDVEGEEVQVVHSEVSKSAAVDTATPSFPERIVSAQISTPPVSTKIETPTPETTQAQHLSERAQSPPPPSTPKPATPETVHPAENVLNQKQSTPEPEVYQEAPPPIEISQKQDTLNTDSDKQTTIVQEEVTDATYITNDVTETVTEDVAVNVVNPEDEDHPSPEPPQQSPAAEPPSQTDTTVSPPEEETVSETEKESAVYSEVRSEAQSEPQSEAKSETISMDSVPPEIVIIEPQEMSHAESKQSIQSSVSETPSAAMSFSDIVQMAEVSSEVYLMAPSSVLNNNGILGHFANRPEELVCIHGI